MLTLKDGPVAGKYMCRRAPLWLRGVIAADGKKDALDQLEDHAAADESVYVYRRVGDVGHVHINMGRKRGTGFYALAEYEYVPDVDGETVRRREDWVAFCAIETNTERTPEEASR